MPTHRVTVTCDIDITSQARARELAARFGEEFFSRYEEPGSTREGAQYVREVFGDDDRAVAALIVLEALVRGVETAPDVFTVGDFKTNVEML